MSVYGVVEAVYDSRVREFQRELVVIPGKEMLQYTRCLRHKKKQREKGSKTGKFESSAVAMHTYLMHVIRRVRLVRAYLWC